jgi:Cft2 family RNA processing exonuclease
MKKEHLSYLTAFFAIVRLERESRFTSVAETIVSRGGSCLIPVFALGELAL